LRTPPLSEWRRAGGEAPSPRRLCRTARIGAVLCAVLGGAAAGAPAAALAAPDDSATAPQPPASGLLGFTNGLDRSSSLLGDMWGVRPLLSQYGITFSLQETSEVLGNVTGGAHRGAAYDGLTQMLLQMDTQRAFGWYGGTFNVSALQIHGTNLSASNLLTLQTASGIEADRATRLWELWYDQKFLDEDRLDVKLGQQSLDQEFMVSQNALVFVNTMFGWPMLPSADLPGGGPAYPLSALGGRVRVHATDSLTVLAGIFNGSPAANGNGDPQMVNPSGTSFPLNGGALYIAELQYAYPSPGTLISPDQGEPLGRLYKLGIWYDTESFADQRFGTDGLSLANPASNGTPGTHRGDFALYAVADQMLWRDPAEADRNVNAFARVMGTPLGDRNLINFSLNVGLTMHEPFMQRDDDTFGIGLGYTSVSPQVSALSRDTAFYTGAAYPVRSSETFVEATYQYEVTPWWQVQPDIQYVFHPGGGVANPNSSSGQAVRDELVLGLRTNILF
jgi:porin